MASLKSEYEQAGISQLASSINWRSAYHKLDQMAIDQSFYFLVLVRSYTENILPLLDANGKTQAEKVLHTISAIVEFGSFYCIEECRAAIEALERLDDDFKYGILHVLLKYARKVKNVKFPSVNEGNVEMLKQAYTFFESSTKKEVDNKKDVVEKGRVRGSLDLVPGIACEGFPLIAKSWVARVAGKDWPPEDVVEKILKAGFQLVPKSSKAADNDTETSFRLSFNTAEELLALSLTKFQRECYRVLKMYYYEILKRDPKVLTTYHLKTVLFWVIESSSADIWIDHNRAHCCMILLKHLKDCLTTGNLQHYFIPNGNLLKYLDKEELKKDMDNLTKLFDNPTIGSRVMIDKIRMYYSTAPLSIGKDFLKSGNIEKFFAKQSVDFEQLQDQFIDSVLAGVVDDDESIGLLLEMTSPKTTSVSKFCFDLISATQNQPSRLFHRSSPLPSPFALLLLMLLPGARDIVNMVLKPLAEKNPRAVNQLKKIELYLQLASMVGLKDLNSFLSHMKSKM